MAIVLGPNRYGKAETRVVRVHRDGGTHTITDLNVSVALAGDLSDTHLTGSNANVLPTDTQKNTVYAFAKQYGVSSPEAFALLLARHFPASQPTITRAEVGVESYGWTRLGPHSFSRDGSATRTCLAVVAASGEEVVGGITGLTLLNSTDSEFTGFIKDGYTTLPEATDRILATAVDARWRYAGPDADFDDVHRRAVAALVAAFTGTYSYSLQQTLYAMGHAVLTDCPELAEIRLRLPNKHHFVVDCTRFGLDDAPEVFHADDRPYGLIEGTVQRDDAPPAGPAWPLVP